MIKRIVDVQLANFRRISGSHRLPLDSDIVVIYGPNGSGKTSIIQAIEYAITGSVGDLRESTDYERVLQNQFSPDPMRVSLTCLNDKGEQLVLQPPDGEGELRRQPELAEVRRYFAERGYLSQHQLTRLLESYQTCGPAGDDQVLVQFIQRLLQLDELMNLSDGLFISLDRRRLRKKLRALEDLEGEEKDLRTTAAETQQSVQEYKASIADTVRRVRSSLDELDLKLDEPCPDDQSAREDVAAWAERVSEHSEAETALLLTAQREYSALLDDLRRVTAGMGSQTLLDDSRVVDARAELLRVQLETSDAQQSLAQHRVRIDAAVMQSGEDFGPDFSQLPDLAYLEVLEDAVQRRLSEVRALLQSVKADKERLSVLENEVIRLDERIAGLQEPPQTDAGRIEKASAVLLMALELVSEDDICPVCSRDFAEVHQGGLRSRITQQIAELQAANEEAVKRSKEYQSAVVQRRVLGIELERLRSGVQGRTDETVLVGRIERLEQTVFGLNEASDSRATVGTRLAEIAAAQALVDGLDRTKARLLDTRSSLLRIQESAGLVASGDGTTLTDLAVGIQVALEARLQPLNDRHERLLVIREALQALETDLAQVKDAEKQAKRADSALSDALRRLKEVDRIEQIGRRLAEASSRTRADALRNAIESDLNEVWRDLFTRLVPTEPFTPELSSPSVERRKLSISAMVRATGVKPMDSQATLSAGNLNTAALCLFLALNMVEAPSLPVIVLDDPIQSMDDIHLVNFAGLLTALSRDGNRQLIVAVHEKALFEYLLHELGPTRPGDSTLGIELIPSDKGEWSFVSTPRVWKVDEVRVS